MSPDEERCVHIFRPTGRFLSRPYTIVQVHEGSIRIEHARHRTNAWTIRDQWLESQYDQFPGEVRRLTTQRKGNDDDERPEAGRQVAD